MFFLFSDQLSAQIFASFLTTTTRDVNKSTFRNDWSPSTREAKSSTMMCSGFQAAAYALCQIISNASNVTAAVIEFKAKNHA